MERCRMCPGVNKLVPGYGPERATYFFLAEAPGESENRIGIPLVGKTGQEFHEHYLPLAGISPGDMFKDNCVSCLPTGDGKLDPSKPKNRELIKCCAEHHVYQEIKRRKPKVIIPMGGVAATLIPGLDLDVHYAMPFTWDVPGVGEHTIFPTFHPALGIHSPKEMARLRNSFIRLKKFTRGELKVPVDQYPNPDFSVLNTVDELDEYILDQIDLDMAIDTEITRKGEPFCLTLSIQPGTARLILASNLAVLTRLNWWVQRWKGWIILHNRLFDKPVLKRMGVVIPPKRIFDTMAGAYQLGNMPQGLKTLSYRYLGAEMHSFDDLVRPYSTFKVLEYYTRGLSVEWAKPPEECIRDTKGLWKSYKPQSFSTKLKRFFTDLGSNPDLDVFDRWDNWEMHHEEIEDKLGPWPGKCITHSPMKDIIPYACQDACRTLELVPIMRKASTLVRRRSAYEWFV